MNDRPSPSPAVAVGRVSISGVSGSAARSVGPAVEKALAAAAGNGRLATGHRARLTIALPHGASADDVAAALVRALEGR